jgi:NADH:ubiquinone oxidoreductase subunit F (NADH-binding)/(2Fe-2S) ferredoxin
MGKLTRDGLTKIKERVQREDPIAAGKKRLKITVHKGTCGIAAGAQKVHDTLMEEIGKNNVDDVLVTTSGCMGICRREPLITIEERDKDTIVYEHLNQDKMEQIFKEHIIGGVVQKDFVMARGREKEIPSEAVSEKDIPHIKETPFFRKQKTIALKNRGLIDAEKIDEYIARNGYMGLAKALKEMTPEEVTEEVKKSGLRGRGGAGFPTGMKWTFAQKAKGDMKYVLCNADEGDPGAFMDRSVLEGDPHAVLEGMLIGGYAIGAHKGYIYCRAEYPLAVRMLTCALEQAREYGLIGKDILGSGYSLNIEVYQGAGAFVCGEETALMASIEGRRGMPRPRPPFPAHQGLWNMPSVLNNVETFACIPQIVLEGGDWFASVGTKNSKGTKVFALTGDVNNVGLVEVPMGTSVRDIVFEIGGGIPDNKKIRAVQLGGPSGGCIPESTLDTPIDYEEITKLGAIMGSGGLIVMDEESCMVDAARFFMEFCQEESCGKCTPCREGTKRMLEILTGICNGKGKDGDIELLEEMAPYVKDSSLCGLGQTAPNPVLTTIRYFRNEYESHIYKDKCPAGLRKSLITYCIDKDLCKGCGLCAKKCPQQCISGEKKEPHLIDKEQCIRCGVCVDVCKFDAVKHI